MHRTAHRCFLTTSLLTLSLPAALAQDSAVTATAADAAAAAAAAATPVVPEKKGWETSVGLTLGLVGGNSENFNVGGTFQTKKEWGKHQILAGADGGYGNSTTKSVVNGDLIETEQTSVNNYGAFLQYNYLLTERWYVGARGEGRHDAIAGVDYRIAATANVGYYIIKKADMFLTVEAGPGYLWEELEGTGYNDYATLRFAENYEWKFSEKSRLFQSFEYLPQISDFGNYVLTGTLGVETDIAKGLALQIVFKDYYRSEPAAWAGTVPLIYRDKNDYQLLAGIIYKFQ